MPIRDIDIADMLTTTLYKLGRGRFEQIAQEIQEYFVMKHLLTKRGGVKIQSSGLGVKETLMNNDGGYSQWVGLYDEDTIVVGDYLDQMKVEWCRLTDNMAYERRELLENKGAERVNNVIRPRRVAMMLRVAKTLEKAFFDTPDADNELVMWGLKYWLVKNSAQGFNGGYPTGFTRIGNVNLTKSPTFKNWTDSYTDVTKQDLIKKMRKAHRKTHWISPVSAEEFRSETGKKRQILVNEETISDMEDVGEAQNENLGRDLASMDDQMVFKKHPIRPVPYLDSDTTNPIYMIDLATFHPIVLKGDYLRESDAKVAPKQHNVFVVHVDLSVNTICTNRRANAVLSK